MKFALASLALAGAASAHTTFQYFQVGGVDYGSDYIRIPPNNNPIQDVTSSNMAVCSHSIFLLLLTLAHIFNDLQCNVNGNVAKPRKATVSAGSVFTVEMHHESRSSQGIDPSHKGPYVPFPHF